MSLLAEAACESTSWLDAVVYVALFLVLGAVAIAWIRRR